MNILVLNVGSASIKYSVYHSTNTIKYINTISSANTASTASTNTSNTNNINYHVNTNEKKNESNSDTGFEKTMTGIYERIYKDKERADCIKKIKKTLQEKNIAIELIGHRVVHGKDIITPAAIDDNLIRYLKSIAELAPLHELPELFVIEQCKKLFPNIKQIAVFDTSFHSTMPQIARIYGLPYSFYEKGIKRYGFHGSSHKYVAEKAEQIMIAETTTGKKSKIKNGASKKKNKNKEYRIITCHLGNGCSITAVKNGRSIDTSMGFTPLEGLIMGTRSGTIDPGIVSYLVTKGYNMKKISNILNNQSGLLGISGISQDMRDLVNAAQTNTRARLALDVFCYNIKKYIGAYAAIMNGIDAIVFTGGIGENSVQTRENIVTGLEYLGIALDKKKNLENKEIISSKASKVKIFVIKTDEELLIAKDAMASIK